LVSGSGLLAVLAVCVGAAYVLVKAEDVVHRLPTSLLAIMASAAGASDVARDQGIRDSFRGPQLVQTTVEQAALSISLARWPPVDLAYEIRIRSGGRPVSTPADVCMRGQAVVPPGAGPSELELCNLMEIDLTAPLPGTVDIELTPSSEAASRTVSVLTDAPVPVLIWSASVALITPASTCCRPSSSSGSVCGKVNTVGVGTFAVWGWVA
jgi:hypothetical protein